MYREQDDSCIMPASLQMNNKRFLTLKLAGLKMLTMCSMVSMTKVAHLQFVQSLWGQLQ